MHFSNVKLYFAESPGAASHERAEDLGEGTTFTSQFASIRTLYDKSFLNYIK